MGAKIIIEFSGEHDLDTAQYHVDMIHQLFMRRDPMDEPHIYIDEGKDDEESESY